MSLGELNDVAGWYAERLLIDCSSVASSLNVPIIFLCEKIPTLYIPAFVSYQAQTNICFKAGLYAMSSTDGGCSRRGSRWLASR